MKKINIWVFGQPFAQSRARVTVNGTYSSASGALKAWRVSLGVELKRARQAGLFGQMGGALYVKMVFMIPTKDSGRWGKWCHMKPDFDNLSKAVCDVMEDVGYFMVGDQQIADAHIRKMWCKQGDAGVMVEVGELENAPSGQSGDASGEVSWLA